MSNKIDVVIRVENELVEKLKVKGINFDNLFVSAANEVLERESSVSTGYPEKNNILINVDKKNDAINKDKMKLNGAGVIMSDY